MQKITVQPETILDLKFSDFHFKFMLLFIFSVFLLLLSLLQTLVYANRTLAVERTSGIQEIQSEIDLVIKKSAPTIID